MNHAAGLVIDEEAAKKHYQLTESESVKNVNMWVGSHISEPQSVHVLDTTETKFETQILVFPPSILQVFMEQIANAIDQKNDCPDATTQFRFAFNVDNGEASVMNNGRSIPVAVVRNSAGQPQWCPEMLCTGFRSSSNHNKTEGAQRITLGAHGIGLKALTAMSKKMRVECVDIERGLYYAQDILDCNTRIMPPTVVTIDKKNKPPTELKNGGTRFTYILDYDFYRSDGRSLPPDIFKTMNRIFHARAYQVAGYACVDTWYNGIKLPVKDHKRLAKMYFPDVEFFTIKHPEHPKWPLGIGFAPITAEKKTEYISIINGGYITKGVHFKHVVDKVCEDLQARVTKSFKTMVWDKKLVKNNLSIIIIGTLPDLIFAQQVKTDLNMKNHAQYFKKLEWPKTYSDKAWGIVNAALSERFIGGDTKRTKSKKLGNPGKYTKAKNLGGPKSDLLGFEGDSAESAATTALSENLPHFSRENIGIILLGGCPMNVQKFMTETKIGDTTHLRPSQRIQDNVVWNDFMTIMNLKYDKKYDTPEALKTLNYQHYTNVTDKDLHGMGKIGAIMLSNILQFWPELLGVPDFLGYFDSPLIRVFPTNPKNSPVLEFRSQSEFDIWCAQFPNGIVPKSLWHPKWYKGMAGHSPEECVHMFRNYNKLRISYTNDQKDALIRLGGYFGKDVSLRKDLLRMPIKPIPDIPDRKSVEISTYCDYYVREEQQYNLVCKLNGVIDGFINTHRKIAWGAMKYKDSARRNAAIKVYQLAGYIAENCSYHHGNDSICNAIIWMSQDFVGARNIPHLLPLSQMGTRIKEGDDGAPRYVDTQCNPIVDAIYPKADRELYEMLIEEGNPTTPKYMIPVVCMPILETNSLPGTGWAITKLARNYYDHVDNIFRLLDGKIVQKMRPWTPGWYGEIVEIGNTEWTVGKCSWDPSTNMVTITELPYRIKVKTYLYGKKKDANVKAKAKADDEDNEDKKITCLSDLDYVDVDTIDDASSGTRICIKFQLKPGAMRDIEEKYGDENFDPLTDYLDLKCHFARGLNFINTNDTVISFSSYEAAMIPWFKERCRIYPLRFERRCILIDLEIAMLNSQIRYIGERAALGVSGKSKVKQDEIVEAAGYRKFNVSKIRSPEVKNEHIMSVVYGDGASFAYLLNISDSDASCEAVEKLHEKIAKLKDERDQLLAPGAMRRIWSEEIAEVTRQINIGHADGWVPKGKYTYT